LTAVAAHQFLSRGSGHSHDACLALQTTDAILQCGGLQSHWYKVNVHVASILQIVLLSRGASLPPQQQFLYVTVYDRGSDGDTGRKSGIWQGSTEVELRQLERQWDDYKVTHHDYIHLIHAPADEQGAVYSVGNLQSRLYTCLLEYTSFNPEPTNHHIQNLPITSPRTPEQPPLLLLYSFVSSGIPGFGF